ncbi:MAG: hypothetical protein ABJG78_05295 [Cyclobacteriaceae bacterium]
MNLAMNSKMRNFFIALFLAASLTVSFSSNAQFVRLDPSKFFTPSEIAAANTAVNEDYLTSEEKNIYLYTNLARLYPKKFYELYRAFVIEDGEESKLRSNRYYSSLSKELKSMTPVGALLPEKKMFELAECWAVESGERGLLGHDRVNCPRGYSGENCGYGYDPTGLYFVMLLLIDDGVVGVGHRKNILFGEFKGLGAAIRDHKSYKYDAVQNFSYTNDFLKEQEELKRQEEEKERQAREVLLERRGQEFAIAMSQWVDEEMKQADVTRELGYLNELEKDLYLYTNLIKLYPKKFKELIWDNGPFFDQLEPELEQGIRKDTNYRRVANWLASAKSGNALVPREEHISVLRCVIDRYLSGKENYKSCFQLAGAWRFQTFYSQSNFNDVMNILLNPDDFNDLFAKGATMVLHKGDPSIKLFLTTN